VIQPFCCNRFADQLERSFSIQRDYDAAVCYKFYSFGNYCREYTRRMGPEPFFTYKRWHLYSDTNKYSCFMAENSDSDSDIDTETDMDD
jgi:hypothetical protein